jgi:hypothetical protein
VSTSVACLSAALFVVLVYALAVTVEYVRLVRAHRARSAVVRARLSDLTAMYKRIYAPRVESVEDAARRRMEFLSKPPEYKYRYSYRWDLPGTHHDPGDEDRR